MVTAKNAQPSMPLSYIKETTQDGVREELDRILSSMDFKASKRRKQFLRFVVEESLSGKTDTIKAYTIAVNVFGRSADFNPQVDPIVSVEASRLRRALAHYYSTAGRYNEIRIDIPKGTYIPRFDKQEPSHAATERRSYQRRSQDCHVAKFSVVDEPGIAVTTFRNISPKKDHDFYAAGLSGQIVANLYGYKDFIIVGPLAGEYIDNPHPYIMNVGKQYGVQFVLSGSVQVRVDSLRVTAWLLDAESGTNVWTEQFNYDLTATDLYAIEDEVAQRIVATLADRLGVITRVLVKRSKDRACKDLTAFEATLKMYHWGIVLTEEAFFEAWQALEHAVKKAPDHALCKAMLADVYASDYLSEIGLVRDRMKTAERLAREAINLDPQSPDARWVMGFVHFLNHKPTQFAKEFEAALALNPNNPMILASYGLFLPGLGQWDQSIGLIDKAMTLNPQISAQYHIPAMLNYYRQGEFDQAYARSLHIETPGLYWEPLFRAAVLGQLGRKDDASIYVNRLLAMQPTFENQAQELMRRLLYSDENVDMIARGLKKAGLSIKSTLTVTPLQTASKLSK
jgi:adenylate cyclase